MSSLIWYIYEFARKTWIDGFFDAKSKEDIAHKPDRFRDFPEVIKETALHLAHHQMQSNWLGIQTMRNPLV